MKRGSRWLCLLTLFTCSLAEGSPAESTSSGAEAGKVDGLIVHEWGVMWVGPRSSDQILGATGSYIESLPKFVIRNEDVSPTKAAQQPLVIDKPVIHFYGEQDQEVSVKIAMPEAAPFVYYPMPKITRNPSAQFFHGKLAVGRGLPIQPTRTTEIEWNFKLHKTVPGKLAEAPKDHWWNDVREVPGDYITMVEGGVCERFLFYEGTTTRKPVITAIAKEESIVVANSHTEDSSPIIILINDSGHIRGLRIESIPAGKNTTVAAHDFKEWDEATILKTCHQHWTDCGMTTEEATGIVKSWEPELLGTKGFLMISRIPRPIYDEIYPITVAPTPASLVRTCMVYDTLHGQDLRKAWLPNQSKLSRVIMKGLADPNYTTRMKARADLIKEGEVMLPYINEALADAGGALDLESKMLLQQIQGILRQSPVAVPTIPGVQNGNVGVPLGAEGLELLIDG